MHAEIHLQRVCDAMVAMLLVVNPAIHLVAQAHAKQSLAGNDADSNSDLGVKVDI